MKAYRAPSGMLHSHKTADFHTTEVNISGEQYEAKKAYGEICPCLMRIVEARHA